jgi:hypothetical protein
MEDATASGGANDRDTRALDRRKASPDPWESTARPDLSWFVALARFYTRAPRGERSARAAIGPTRAFGAAVGSIAPALAELEEPARVAVRLLRLTGPFGADG